MLFENMRDGLIDEEKLAELSDEAFMKMQKLIEEIWENINIREMS